MTARVVADDDAGRVEAIATLRAGGVVALPTDTVYGIAVALDTPGGIERLYRIKRRPPDKGIALLIADPAQAADIAVVTPAAVALGAALLAGRADHRPRAASGRRAAGRPDRRLADDRPARAGPRRAPGAGPSRRAVADDLREHLRPAGGARRGGDRRPAGRRGGPGPRRRPGPWRAGLDRGGLQRRSASDPPRRGDPGDPHRGAADRCRHPARHRRPADGDGGQSIADATQNAATPMAAAASMPRNVDGQASCQRSSLGSAPRRRAPRPAGGASRDRRPARPEPRSRPARPRPPGDRRDPRSRPLPRAVGRGHRCCRRRTPPARRTRPGRIAPSACRSSSVRRSAEPRRRRQAPAMPRRARRQSPPSRVSPPRNRAEPTASEEQDGRRRRGATGSRLAGRSRRSSRAHPGTPREAIAPPPMHRPRRT